MKKSVASDWAWQLYGKKDPYYGVCTQEMFKSQNLSEESLNAFFASGVNHVERVMRAIQVFRKNFEPKTILDYGCGTGRLVIPFAKIARQVTGIDVSEYMLDETKRNLERLGITNVELLLGNSPDVISPRKFDLVHTFIVLQHVPVVVGYAIFESLAKAVAADGIGAIHVTYSNKQSRFKRMKTRLRSRYKWFAQFSNIIRLRHPNQPEMQMNNYDLAQIFKILESIGVTRFYTALTDHGGFHGAFIFFERTIHEEQSFT
jgi:2-polyprenyl-3-methyl-5-hydroxy-6-metoxy-1,4-benzoquinol methylase